MKTEDPTPNPTDEPIIPPSPPSSSEISTSDEKKPSLVSPDVLGIVEVDKPKFHKKVDITFQLGQLKRFILFGTETHYKSCSRRSINRWFVTETNIRLFVEECKIKCLRCLSAALEVLEDSKNQWDKSRSAIIFSRMVGCIIENVYHSQFGVIPYLLSRIYSFPPLRPILPKVFLAVIRDSTELLLFAHYLKKVKGNHESSRRILIEWYKVHSEIPELLKDLLLVKRRVGWTHRDVIIYWKIPVPESNGILRLLMGFPFDPTKIAAERISLVEKLVELRKVDDRMDWLDLVNSEDYIKEIGLDLCYNVKTRIFNVDVLKILIERLPLYDLIEHIPRMWQKFPWSKELTKSLIDQLTDWKTKYAKGQRDKVNILSVFVVWKWLVLQEYLFYGEGKNLREPGTIDPKYYPQSVAELGLRLLSILEDNDYKRSDEVLFILNIPGTDLDESGSNFSKKSSFQELKRPILFPNVVKPIDFIQFLIFIYPQHRIIYKDKNYRISGNSYEKVGDEFNKMRQSATNCLPTSPIKSYKHSIVITFDGSVDLTDDSPLNKHSVDKIVVLSVRDKHLTQFKEKSTQRNLLIIKGLDCNFLSHIKKYFLLNC